MTHEQLGGVGTSRKVAGFMVIVVFAVMSFLSGFEFYNVVPSVLWVVGIIGLSLMIAGIAKDVIAIAKGALK